MTSTQTEDGGLGLPVMGVNLVFLWAISVVDRPQIDLCCCFRRVLTSLYEVERWVEGVLLLPLPVCLQSFFPAMPTHAWKSLEHCHVVGGQIVV